MFLTKGVNLIITDETNNENIWDIYDLYKSTIINVIFKYKYFKILTFKQIHIYIYYTNISHVLLKILYFLYNISTLHY